MARLSSAQEKSEMPHDAVVRRSLSILGATGSIGKNTLDLVSRTPDAFEIIALTAQNRVAELAESAKRVGARLAVIGNERQYGELKSLLSGTGIKVAAGPTAVIAAAAEPADCVMAAIVGAAGLEPTFEAVRQGRRLALANKECLVSAGAVFMAAVARAGAELLPVDSEHSAALQVVGNAEPASIEKLTLTASGGPFRTWDEEQLARATPEEALRHPNWSMGAKVTIDSATLMNKGLELIEAYHLFPVDADQLGVVVHPSRSSIAWSASPTAQSSRNSPARYAHADSTFAVLAATHDDANEKARSGGAWQFDFRSTRRKALSRLGPCPRGIASRRYRACRSQRRQ